MTKFIPVCEPTLLGNELKYVQDAVSTGWISSGGKYVTAFEEAFAKYSDCQYGVGVCNGTVALHLALTALGIGKGDEVIIPAFTMIASAFAVCYTGAVPVFVDADPRTWNIDADQIEAKITAKTKAIMPVHIFGNPCNMEKIEAIAQKHKLFILEDAAEAHGATYKGKKVGSFSAIAAFSFYANKNLTTGEGGMVVTNDSELYQKAKYFKNLCFAIDKPRDYVHQNIGFNYRMSNLHAAIGLAQVEKAAEYQKMRINNANLYKKLLSNVKGIYFQQEDPNVVNVHWMNGILLKPREFGRTRDELIKVLKEKGIDTRNFFVGMHKQPSLKDFGCNCTGKYPVCDDLAENGFYLPSSSSLTAEQIEYICTTLRGLQGN